MFVSLFFFISIVSLHFFFVYFYDFYNCGLDFFILFLSFKQVLLKQNVIDILALIINIHADVGKVK